jgi:hypothetical protein
MIQLLSLKAMLQAMNLASPAPVASRLRYFAIKVGQA